MAYGKGWRRMTKWLIDFDATLADTFLLQLDTINKKFNTCYTEDDFPTWSTEDVLPPDIVEFMWSDKVFLSEEFQMAVRPVPHAILGVQKLMRCGDECMVVSDRPQALYEVTARWLAAHGLPNLPVIFTRSVHSKSDQLLSIMTKSQIAYLYRLTHVVEDSPHHSIALAERSYVDKVYLIDKLCNRHIEHPKIQRIKTWEEVEA